MKRRARTLPDIYPVTFNPGVREALERARGEMAAERLVREAPALVQSATRAA